MDSERKWILVTYHDLKLSKAVTEQRDSTGHQQARGIWQVAGVQ